MRSIIGDEIVRCEFNGERPMTRGRRLFPPRWAGHRGRNHQARIGARLRALVWRALPAPSRPASVKSSRKRPTD